MCTGIALPNATLNTFAYDADLVRRQAEDSEGLRKFVNDEQNVLIETDSGGTTQAAYTLEPAFYGNLVSQRRSGATAWHLYDALGSTDRLTDSSQAAVATYIHTAFGVPKATTGNHPNCLRFGGRVGYRFEQDTQLYDLRRRKYRASRGQMISADPLRSDACAYAYVGNDPGSALDPSGLYRADVHRGDTTTLANRAKVVRTINGCPYVIEFTPSVAGIIGWADILVDYSTAPGGAYHFTPGLYGGTRQQKAAEELAIARQADSFSDCAMAYTGLGRSIHPKQDDWGHLDLTPCEHLHAGNDPYVDERNRDRGRLRGRVPWRGPRWAWLLCRNSNPREWDWPMGSSRHSSCLNATCAALYDWLNTAQHCFNKRKVSATYQPPRCP